jgi:methionine synthase II (cobalamin-independent)
MQITANGRPPFRADHIGSLLRPRKLRDAFRQHADGRMNDTALRATQDAAIREVVKLQEECGLQVVTDGEFRRLSYWEKFVRLTGGLTVQEALFKFHDDHGHESDFSRWTSCGAARTRRRSTWTPRAWPSARNAASPAPWEAIR